MIRQSSADIGIIIPTHNRSASLQRTLDALCEQNVSSTTFDVVVVADNCTDDTLAMVNKYQAPYRLAVVDERLYSAGAARNAGVAKCEVPLVLFLDDDVVPSENLIIAHLQAHKKSAGLVVLGPYKPVVRHSRSYHRNTIRRWWDKVFEEMSRPDHVFTFRDFLTGNVSVHRSDFLRVGGFDPAFQLAGGEDWELGIRLLDAGLLFRYCSRAEAFHFDHETMDLAKSYSRARVEGRADVIIGQAHRAMIGELKCLAYTNCSGYKRLFLRHLIFRRKTLGELLMVPLSRSLPLLEWFRLRRLWSRLFDSLLEYWYLRGIADKYTTHEELIKLGEEHMPPAMLDEPRLIIDLANNPSGAIEQADRIRPVSLEIRYGDLHICKVGPFPGTEPFLARHLPSVLWLELKRSPFLWLLRPQSLRPGSPDMYTKHLPDEISEY